VERTRSTHFPLFDSLRALAALGVFAIHAVYQIAVNRPEDHDWYRFGVHLDVAVPIFFGISGFLLYRPFLAATVAGEPISVRAYAWRRALRIAPAYWVALAVITVWFGLEEVQSVGGALRFGLFAQVYDADTALKGLGQAWSLDIEAAFYVFLPLFALGLAKARTVRHALLAVGGLIGFSLAWQAFVLLVVTDAANPESRPWLYALPAHLDHLGAGMLLAVLSVAAARRGGGGHLLSLVERRPGIPWALAAVAWVVAALLTGSGTRADPLISDPQYLLKRVLYAVVVFLLIVPAVFGDRTGEGAVRRLMAWRPLVYVGTISYSLYLWHFAVIAQALRWWDRGPESSLEWMLWTAGTLAGSVLVASLSHFAIERPFMSLKRLVPAGPRAPQVEAAQARAAP
jgi:peptidoglycan/LPS O-acetylase OafA/YrhL